MLEQNQTFGFGQTPTPEVIGASDLSYAGCFRLPPGVADMTTFAYGGVTGRTVAGQLRLLFTGSEAELDAPIIEVADPGTYDTDYRRAPRAMLTQTWDTKYRAKRGTWRGPFASDRPGEPFFPFATNQAVNGGVYWHEPTQLLFITYTDVYNVGAFGDWGLIAVRLGRDKATETFGPWRLKATDSRGTWYGPHRALLLAGHPLSGKLITGSTIGSGNVNYPWGPDLYGDLDWPTPSLPAGVRAPDLVLQKRYLEYYFMGSVIDPRRGTAQGPIKSFRRRVDPAVYEYFPATAERPEEMVLRVDPARYGGVGSWSDLDSVGGLMWLRTATKHGVLFCGAVAGSPVQDSSRPDASHVWYANMFKKRCSHGVEAPIDITGPVSTAHFPYLCCYDPATLEAVAKGQKTDYEVEPVWFLNLTTKFSIKTASEEVPAGQRNLQGFYWDADRKLLFTIAHRADDVSVPGTYASLVHVFHIRA
jgi:hypothetical protein